MWKKERTLTPGDLEFHLAGLREHPETLRVLEGPLAAATATKTSEHEASRREEWNPKWS